jgi:hypothetical protein
VPEGPDCDGNLQKIRSRVCRFQDIVSFPTLPLIACNDEHAISIVTGLFPFIFFAIYNVMAWFTYNITSKIWISIQEHCKSQYNYLFQGLLVLSLYMQVSCTGESTDQH